jgi:alpha-tubulin suppressor-like RCC1 family protein
VQISPSTSIQATKEINAVETGAGIVAISANSNRNLALDDSGRLWEWGKYQEASCIPHCLGLQDCKLRPSLVPGLTDGVSISVGYDHNLALKRDGTVWGWGENDTFQLG